jgi:hypothetical protein
LNLALHRIWLKFGTKAPWNNEIQKRIVNNDKIIKKNNRKYSVREKERKHNPVGMVEWRNDAK